MKKKHWGMSKVDEKTNNLSILSQEQFNCKHTGTFQGLNSIESNFSGKLPRLPFYISRRLNYVTYIVPRTKHKYFIRYIRKLKQYIENQVIEITAT